MTCVRHRQSDLSRNTRAVSLERDRRSRLLIDHPTKYMLDYPCAMIETEFMSSNFPTLNSSLCWNDDDCNNRQCSVSKRDLKSGQAFQNESFTRPFYSLTYYIEELSAHKRSLFRIHRLPTSMKSSKLSIRHHILLEFGTQTI
jgi:hypothetical protein